MHILFQLIFISSCKMLFMVLVLINYNIPGGTMFICALYMNMKMPQYHHLIHHCTVVLQQCS